MAPFRFRAFYYEDYNDIWDSRVLRYLPADSHDIQIYKKRNGWTAKYSIAQADLDQWYDDLLARVKDHVEHPGKPPRSAMGSFPPRELGVDKNRGEWIYYEGPRAGNWAGFSIWYSIADGTAHETTADW